CVSFAFEGGSRREAPMRLSEFFRGRCEVGDLPALRVELSHLLAGLNEVLVEPTQSTLGGPPPGIVGLGSKRRGDEPGPFREVLLVKVVRRFSVKWNRAVTSPSCDRIVEHFLSSRQIGEPLLEVDQRTGL